MLAGIEGEANYAQPLRLVRNRAHYANWDGDGLDYRVEAELGTCDHPYDHGGAVSCQAIADVRDTDGDGISDGWETLGYEAAGGAFLNDQPLPFWAASPRHKDLFHAHHQDR